MDNIGIIIKLKKLKDIVYKLHKQQELTDKEKKMLYDIIISKEKQKRLTAVWDNLASPLPSWGKGLQFKSAHCYLFNKVANNAIWFWN